MTPVMSKKVKHNHTIMSEGIRDNGKRTKEKSK